MSSISPQIDRDESFLERAVSVLVNTTKRQYVFTIFAYMTGILGLGTVFAQDFWLSVPDTIAVPVSIALMGISFFSLFVATLSGPVER